MARTARYTLTTTPVQVDLPQPASSAARNVLVIAQATGTLVICEDGDGYTTGARIPVVAGDSVSFDNVQGAADVWLAAAAALDVDVLEMGAT